MRRRALIGASAALLVPAASRAGPSGTLSLERQFEEWGGRAAALLAREIAHARDAALAAGVSPVPPAVAAAVAGHVAPAAIAATRWRVQRPAEASLPAVLLGPAGADAVTLGHVVVFRDRAVSRLLWLWAHELTHVEQVLRLGLDGFARAYLADFRRLEAEADTRAAAVLRGRPALLTDPLPTRP